MNYDFKEKPINMLNANNYMLAKTLSMFEWQGLPDSIPKRELERLLQVSGYAFITEVNGKLYALNGGMGGVPDAYGRPTEIIINSPALNFNKNLSLADDGVLVINDDSLMGLMPLIDKYNYMLMENEISMILYGFATRSKTLISASDDATKASAEKYLKDVIAGQVGIIGESAVFDGLRVQPSHSGQGAAANHLTDYHQFIKSLLYTELGITEPNNMKKERLINAEVEQMSVNNYPLVYNMMENRTLAANELNARYGLSVSVGFGSVWRDNLAESVDGVVTESNESNGSNESNETNESNESTESNESNESTESNESNELKLLYDMLKEKDLTESDIIAIKELIGELG